jgi:Lipid-A-disaccharide synthetase
MPNELILLVNGPGELYTWVRPLLRELRALESDTRVVLGLLPCPFASGYERGIAEKLDVDAIASVAECLEFIAGGRKPQAFQGGSSGLVIGLGGDVAFPGRIGSRLGYPAWRYSFEPYWNANLERLLVHDAKTLVKAVKSGARAESIGNLTADALALENATRDPSSFDVLLVPGSRAFQVVHLLPYFAGAAELIAARLPQARFFVPRSNLIQDEVWQKAISGVQALDFGGVPMRSEHNMLITPKGVRLEIIPEQRRYHHMKTCAVAITSPGTNTLELGIAGAPSVVCMPLQKMELIPIENPLRYLQAIPIIGKPLKRKLVTAYLERFKFVALPNMFADEAIQPELRGNISTQQIAEAALNILEHPTERQRIAARLEATMPKGGAARVLAQKMLERVEGHSNEAAQNRDQT